MFLLISHSIFCSFDDDAEQAFRIVDVVGDSPAARSGDLQGGDNIISINGVPTTELTYAKAIHTLTTTTRVTLEAERGRQGPSLQLSTSKTNQQHQCVPHTTHTNVPPPSHTPTHLHPFPHVLHS